MPHVDLNPPSGPISAFYYISTPESHNADEILNGIPTVLFLHPSGMASYVFECKFILMLLISGTFLEFF